MILTGSELSYVREDGIYVVSIGNLKIKPFIVDIVEKKDNKYF